MLVNFNICLKSDQLNWPSMNAARIENKHRIFKTIS